MKTNIILQGDALTKLKELPEKSINMCMTSPPYWALRDYGENNSQVWGGKEDCEHDWGEPIKGAGKNTDSKAGELQKNNKGSVGRDNRPDSNFCLKCGAWKGQLGLEPTFDLYIKHLADIFEEVKRVLRDDGTCWVNIGDTYNSHSTGKGEVGGIEGNRKNKEDNKANTKKDFGLIPDKCLTMIPMRFAIEMVNRGWILRNTIIWHKRNCMPSSVKDRFTVDFEYIFFFSKKKNYYFETQLEPLAESSLNDSRLDKGREEHIGKSSEGIYGCNATTINSKGRNKRAVWTINPKPFKEAHFAVYPEELCETPIKAGCPEFICVKCGNPKIKEFKREVETLGVKRIKRDGDDDRAVGGVYQKFMEENPMKEIIKSTCKCNAGFTSGIVIDPFSGAGTTSLVALKQNKKFIGIELNKEYIEIANKRLKPFLEQTKLNTLL